MAKILHTKKHNDFFRQLLFLCVLIVAGIIIFTQLRFFVGAALGAFTLYVVFRGLLFRMTGKLKWKPWLAALSLTILCFVILSVVGYITYKVIASELPDVDASDMLQMINRAMAKLDEAVGFKVIPDSVIEQSGGLIGGAAEMVFNTTYSFAANIFMMLVIVYFMFAKGSKMESYAYQYIPFKGKSLVMLRSEVKNIVFSNAVGIPLIMITQGLTSIFIYWLMGVDNFLFWGFLTAVCGLIPLVGSALVYVPIGIYYVAAGNLLTALIIVSYGFIVVANVDNVIRIILMRKMSGTHPLIVIFGVILGIPLFGFWGIIFGPLFISAFFLLIRIYYMEYGLLTPYDEACRIANSSSSGLGQPPAVPYNPVETIRSPEVLKTAHMDKMKIHAHNHPDNQG